MDSLRLFRDEDLKSVGSDRGSTQFSSMEEYVKAMGGKRPITKILIANNGIAAVKAIRSIKRWCYETFGDDKTVSFVAMATPEDLKANAEYIHLADEFIRVPGGSNNHNYANIMLIAEIAERCGADAVWAGWGHASENPKLPELLSKTKNKVVWIGPPPEAMRALGDKIGSTLIAQSANVSCMPWSGDGLEVNYAASGIPDDIYMKACVSNIEECVAAANRIGFPIMIKASEGGGGKGIRKVENSDQIELAFNQVKGEVPGSPIFLMKLAPIARHLEVQLLGDEWGDAIAIFGRDCSVQRRHQKIIEEGPVVAAPPDTWKEMEKAAIRLAKEVNYVGAGTVEYLYTPNDNKYYFLELNPRLQVEHPVSELISGVNLPAAQLQVAMGVPLSRVRGVRRMYGKSPAGSSKIDFERAEPTLLPGHVIACRITAENPEASFQPTSGVIKELNFRSTPDVWGYFSVTASGSVHEYSDSQFGHLFAIGDTRDIARQNMVVALRELSIRGDIRTTIEYLPKVLETEDFKANHIDTTWLERVMAGQTVQVEKPPTNLVIILAAAYRAHTTSSTSYNEYMATLERGQLPSSALHSMVMEGNGDLIYEGTKYLFDSYRSGPNSFEIVVNGVSVATDVHVLADGGLLVLVGGKKHVVYGQDFPTGLRLVVDGKTCIFSVEYDPSQLKSSMAGKLVRFLVADGTHLAKDAPYAEMEVMKMYVTLKAPESGRIRLVMPEGSILESGDLLATLDLDNPDTVEKAVVFKGTFPLMSDPHAVAKANLVLANSRKQLQMVLQGYKLGPGAMETHIEAMMRSLRNPQLPLLQFEEAFSALAGRIPEDLFDSFQNIVKEFTARLSQDYFYWEKPATFPVVDIQSAIDAHVLSAEDARASATLKTHLAPVFEILKCYTSGNHNYAVQIICAMLEEYYRVEHIFTSHNKSHGYSDENVVRELRRAHKEDLSEVATIALAHHQVEQRADLAFRLLDSAESSLTPLISKFIPTLKLLSQLTGTENAAVVLKARQLIMREELPSKDERRIAIQTIISTAAAASNPDERLGRLNSIIKQSQPIGDIVLNLFDQTTVPLVMETAMEAFIRRSFEVFHIDKIKVSYMDRTLLLGKFHYWMKQSKRNKSENDSVAQNTMDRIVSVSDLQMFVNSSPKSGSSPKSVKLRETSVKREGVMSYSPTFDHLKENFDRILSQFEGRDSDSTQCVNVLYLVLKWTRNGPTDEQFVQYFSTFLKLHTEKLRAAGVRRATFVLTTGALEYPSYFTFRERDNYSEDAIVRHIEPCYAPQLELHRLTNFNVKFVPTTNRMVHLFEADPLESMIPSTDVVRRSGAGNVRYFARVIVRAVDSHGLINQGLALRSSSFGDVDVSEYETDEGKRALDFHPETEFAFVEALNSLEVAMGGGKKLCRGNNIFINVLVEAVLSVDYVEAVIRMLAKRYAEKVHRLGVETVEFACVARPSPDAPAVPLRFVATNQTGAALYVDVYAMVRQNKGGLSQTVFKLIKKGGSTSGELDSMDASTPYPVVTHLQPQRYMARNVGTTYAYDFIHLFEKAIRQMWRSVRKSTGIDVPSDLISARELVLKRKDSEAKNEDDSADGVNRSALDRLNLYTLEEVTREPGHNSIGMVAWVMRLKTPSFPEGRDVVLISNDVTFKVGTFGVREDLLFMLASKYARERGLPRLYFSANSGARIGLAEEVRSKISIAWIQDDASKGFDYLYLTEEASKELSKSVVVEAIEVNGEVRHKIIDIIGVVDGLGVENLSGSGMIAGETSAAYDECFTLTYVTGRSVGIGAYLARLGHRVIQLAGSPILLTGYNALNKLLGREVYSSNDQLGGVDIMHPNGVSHLIVESDMGGVQSSLKWLEYVPASRKSSPPVPDVATLVDPVSRKVEMRPSPSPHDPRTVLQGTTDAEGNWIGGLFDKGSWMEIMSGWAKTVITGRAKLGGIPVGVIAVETRTVEVTVPADPASADSKERVVMRAGQVWYPDSAYKTSQAINDMSGEGLPIMILANWRGFSGGMQDMYDEVLKFGSYIVDSLRSHSQPVFVYLPPHATLRGGAWVVVDSTINPDCMEMYAAEDSRGGVLEAEGTVDVKFRKRDIALMQHRLDKQLRELDGQLRALQKESTEKSTPALRQKITSVKAAIAQREKALGSVYHQAAAAFCDLHDTPGRMHAKKAVSAVVPWAESRSFFYWRLRRRLIEDSAARRFIEASSVGSSSSLSLSEAKKKLAALLASKDGFAASVTNDQLFVEWGSKNLSVIDEAIANARKKSVEAQFLDLASSDASGAAQLLLSAISSLTGDEAVAVQKALRQLSSKK